MEKTYRWNGKQGKGAMRSYREGKRWAAEARNEATPPERRRQARLQRMAMPSLKEQRRVVERSCSCIASIRPRAACICK